jgi:hypothetical protein
MGTWTPPTVGALPLPPILLAERIDPETRELVSVNLGEDPIDAALQWQFTVRQGSGSAIGTNGHRMHTIKKATPQAPVQLADEARRVVQKFVQRGQLEKVSIQSAIVGGSTATGAVQIAARNVLADRAAKLPAFGGF